MLFCNLFNYHLPPSVILKRRFILKSGVAGSNPAGGEILPEPKRRFIAQSLSCSPFHRLEMTEILLKGRKTLTHPSIHSEICLEVEKKMPFLHFNTFLPSRHAFVKNGMQCSKLQSLSHRILNFVLKNKEPEAYNYTKNRSPFSTCKCYKGEWLIYLFMDMEM